MSQLEKSLQGSSRYRPNSLEGRRALVGGLLGGIFGALGALLAKSLLPTLELLLAPYPVWLLPAVVAGLVAVMVLGLMLLPLTFNHLRSLKDTDA